MKAGIVILLVSLAANAALGFFLARDRQPPSTAVEIQKVQLPTKAISQSATPSAEPEVTTSAPNVPDGFHWAQLESGDYREYINRLRAFGVPERTIRDIIMADVGKLYRPKLAALRPPRQSENPKFWERKDYYGQANRPTKEQSDQLRILQKERTELVKTLLGEDVYKEISKDSGYPDYTEQMFGNIPEETRKKVTELQEKYQEARSDIYAKMDGYMDMDTQAEMKALTSKFNKELAGLLPPEQMQTFLLRTSDVANQMRYSLSAFEPNEQEFRAIFDYKQSQEDLNGSRRYEPGQPPPSADERKAAADKLKELNETLASTLGADRLKEYKLMDDYSYRNLFDMGVAKETVLQIPDLKQQAEQAAASLRQNQSLTQEERNAAMAAIRTETEKTLNTLLGERRARAYGRSGGYWLRNLAPRN